MNRRNGEQINKWTQQPRTMGQFQKYDICIIGKSEWEDREIRWKVLDRIFVAKERIF